jgi:AraC-like DNA-binding protein
LLSILAATILLWVNNEQSHSKRILVAILLILALLNFNGVFFHAGFYLLYPWFHKVLIPFSLLLAPATYIYIRAVLLVEYRFKKYDWLFALPSVFFAINLLPYYFMPAAEKHAYLIEYYQKSSLRASDGEGFLPAFVFSFLRVAWSFIFIVFNYQLIHGFKRRANKKILTDNGVLLNWLTILNIMLTCFITAALFAAIIAPFIKTTFTLLNISLGIFSIIICLTLFFQPKILYGVYQPLFTVTNDEPLVLIKAYEINESHLEENKFSVTRINQSDGLRYKRVLENHFIEKLPFLRTNYSLEDLVEEVKIPRYILSAFINKEYGMGFREFLNRYRVNYMIDNLNKKEWENFTLDAIATECGFKSRITFFKNFKQITGETPSQYIKTKSLTKNG